jgi:hypothetical protein
MAYFSICKASFSRPPPALLALIKCRLCCPCVVGLTPLMAPLTYTRMFGPQFTQTSGTSLRILLLFQGWERVSKQKGFSCCLDTRKNSFSPCFHWCIFDHTFSFGLKNGLRKIRRILVTLLTASSIIKHVPHCRNLANKGRQLSITCLYPCHKGMT